jgi:tRNA-intron endonuclease
MQISGELYNNKIIIEKPKEVGRLFNKSHFGNTINGNKLQIDLLEGVFLKGEDKIRLFRDRRELKFEEVVRIASQCISDFEIKYLTFKDLRNRGYIIKISNRNDPISFYQFKQKRDLIDNEKLFVVSIFSERGAFNLEDIRKLIKNARREKKVLWFALVDEEGDITYYEVSTLDLTGNNIEYEYKKVKGILLENRLILFDKKLSKSLFEKEFYGKPFSDGLQLSFVETLYLLDKGLIEVFEKNGLRVLENELWKKIKQIQPDINLRYIVFKDLKERGLLVKTGFKFGAHFRAYSKKPDETHADYLINVVEKGFKSNWSEISRAVRLAHSVNKEIIYARVNKNKIEYIKFGRLRP